MTSSDILQAHQQFHLNLLKSLYNQLGSQLSPGDASATGSDDNENDDQLPATLLLDNLAAVIEALQTHQHDALPLGQQWVGQLMRSHPQLMPLINRDLLWFFGGDCLHYMEDEEIHRYQQLDELRFAAEADGKLFKREEAKAKLFGLH